MRLNSFQLNLTTIIIIVIVILIILIRCLKEFEQDKRQRISAAFSLIMRNGRGVMSCATSLSAAQGPG